MAVGISPLADRLNSYLSRKYTDEQRNRILQWTVFALTYVSYALYHANRKVLSVVKPEWSHNCTQAPNDSNHDPGHGCAWPPFDGANAQSLLGYMDFAYLISYALGMYACGYIAERNNLRKFLSFGMLVSSIFNILVGAGYWMNIHVFYYYLIMNILAGGFQSTGCPASIAMIGYWFGQGRRGLIMGAWNTNTYLGNVFGSALASAFVERDWGLSFTVPAAITIGMAGVVWLLAVPKPKCVGLQDPNRPRPVDEPTSAGSGVTNAGFSNEPEGTELKEVGELPKLESTLAKRKSVSASITVLDQIYSSDDMRETEEPKAIGFVSALLIPGVLTYSIAIFFIKFVNYVFMFWLPTYLNATAGLSASDAALVSILFDVGAMVGAVASGLLNDVTRKPANICVWSLVISLPLLYGYTASAGGWSYLLLLLIGVTFNAPYSLITCAVAADLGTDPSLDGNASALASVAAIIDGTGSIGAAVGPAVTGLVEQQFGWDAVFVMLVVTTGISILCLLQLVVKEIRSMWKTAAT